MVAGLLVASMNVVADATLYRWKDSEGNIVMSDRPPPTGTEYEAIATDSSVVRRVEGEPAPEPVVAKPRPKPAPPPETSKTVYEENPEYCENARKNLELIDRAPRIRMADENGEMRYITDDERAAQRETNLTIIERYCP
ncbi:DUF4124 domain-containing protein [Seongchinamella sediminis]|uniref:DUF4124 domain-containing protein n=2 Tax=Seongchinamella sediminis TaxID=2283635 RepID=A0A3L7DXT9_9GAMM|nr:DUF4124 domain-containing protein [Seongchinamella sediminis]